MAGFVEWADLCVKVVEVYRVAVVLFMSSRGDWVPREDWAIVVEESRRVWRLAVLMRRDRGPKTFH